MSGGTTSTADSGHSDKEGTKDVLQYLREAETQRQESHKEQDVKQIGARIIYYGFY